MISSKEEQYIAGKRQDKGKGGQLSRVAPPGEVIYWETKEIKIMSSHLCPASFPLLGGHKTSPRESIHSTPHVSEASAFSQMGEGLGKCLSASSSKSLHQMAYFGGGMFWSPDWQNRSQHPTALLLDLYQLRLLPHTHRC